MAAGGACGRLVLLQFLGEAVPADMCQGCGSQVSTDEAGLIWRYVARSSGEVSNQHTVCRCNAACGKPVRSAPSRIQMPPDDDLSDAVATLTRILDTASARECNQGPRHQKDKRFGVVVVAERMDLKGAEQTLFLPCLADASCIRASRDCGSLGSLGGQPDQTRWSTRVAGTRVQLGSRTGRRGCRSVL